VRISRLHIVGAAAVVAVAAGGGVALAVDRHAASSPRAEHEAFLADVAGRLGVSVDDLKQAFREAAEARGSRQGGPPFGRGLGQDRRHGFGRHGHWRGAHESFGAAADYLGLTRGELMQQLFSGRSLADIAESRGKPVDGLKQAIRTAIVERLDGAVADGRLTEEKKQKVIDRLDAIVDDLVQRSRAPRGADS
jgi:hypothetical protein